MIAFKLTSMRVLAASEGLFRASSQVHATLLTNYSAEAAHQYFNIFPITDGKTGEGGGQVVAAAAGRTGFAANREKLTTLPAAENAAANPSASDGPCTIEMPKQSATNAAPMA